MQLPRKRKKEAGFTLVELAIVLVIIGLIVGGVLVGQDLIKSAEIRSFVTDFEKINAGANTFRSKYNGLPGDLLSPRATTYGLEDGGTDGTDGLGDGDGSLENGGTVADKQGVGGENTLFWRHLGETGLFNVTSLADGSVAIALDATTLPDYLPNAGLREAAYVHAFGLAGRNFFAVSDISAVAAATGAPTDTGNILTNYEASQIDEKMDDGLPTRGSTIVIDDATAASLVNASAGAAPGTGVCVDEGANPAVEGDETYILNDAGGVGTAIQDELNCALRIRSNF